MLFGNETVPSDGLVKMYYFAWSTMQILLAFRQGFRLDFVLSWTGSGAGGKTLQSGF